MLLVGIGETFTKNRKKWKVINIREGNYTCESQDREKIIKNFTKIEMYKIFGSV